MKWLLDTNVVSESVRVRPNARVMDWVASKGPDLLALSIVTLAELRDGASSVRDQRRRTFLAEWIEIEVVNLFRNRTLPLTSDILVEWMRLTRSLRKKGNLRDATDLLIAATARTHDLIVVSRNARHFAGTSVMLYEPWSGETHRT